MNETPEFSLLLLLTHPQPDEQYSVVRQLLAENEIDWQDFLEKVRWHRVTPQVYEALKIHRELVPVEFMSELQKVYKQCNEISLQQATWLVKISRLFRENQIDFIALKGVLLSQFMYQDCAKREAKDIDIIIDYQDLKVADKLLIEVLGFSKVTPHAGATQKQISVLNKRIKDRKYVHKSNGTQLELHWRFWNLEELLNIPFSKMKSESRLIPFFGESVPFLSYRHLFLYQSFHGSMSNWYRLHWVSDVAMMLSMDQPDWEGVVKASEQFVCSRNLVEAVMLAGDLYQLPIPDEIKASFGESRQQKAQLRCAKWLLSQAQLPSLRTKLYRDKFFLTWSVFLRSYVDKLWLQTGDFKLYTIPDRWFFLYYWLRPVFYASRLLGISGLCKVNKHKKSE